MNQPLVNMLTPLIRWSSVAELQTVADPKNLSLLGSHFGGTPYAEQGESWPTCPKCEAALSFICQINLTECPHTPVQKVDLLTFSYCWKCLPWGGPDEMDGEWVVRLYADPQQENAALISDGRSPLHTLDHAPDRPATWMDKLRAFFGQTRKPSTQVPRLDYWRAGLTKPCSVTWEAAQSLPDWEGIRTVYPKATELVEKENPGDPYPWEPYSSTVEQIAGAQTSWTKVGGYPSWVQNEETPICPECRERMRLLVQIDSEDKADLMWGDVGCAYLFVCPEHLSQIRFDFQCS